MPKGSASAGEFASALMRPTTASGDGRTGNKTEFGENNLKRRNVGSFSRRSSCLALVMIVMGASNANAQLGPSGGSSELNVCVSNANVALASRGAVATASSTVNAAFPVSSVIDGVRKTANWGNGDGWNDATPGTFPDWVQIKFPQEFRVCEIKIVTVQENVNSPNEPTASMTFSTQGITDYIVQYWNNNAWVTFNNGTVTGNRLVMKTVNPGIAGIFTDRIRLTINGSGASTSGRYSRVAEIEAWGYVNSVEPSF